MTVRVRLLLPFVLTLALLGIPACGSGSTGQAGPSPEAAAPAATGSKVYADPVARFSVAYDPTLVEPLVDETAADQWGRPRRLVAFRSTDADAPGAISIALDDCAVHESAAQADAFWAGQFAQLTESWRALGFAVERDEPRTTPQGTVYAARATKDGETAYAEYELVKGTKRYSIQLAALGPDRQVLGELFRSMVASFSTS